MIEILTLAASVTKVAGAISSGIKAGRDVASLMPMIGKLGELDAEIQIAETGQHKGVISKLTSTEQDAFAISQAKLSHKRAMNELRSYMMLFGETGSWETFQRELGIQRRRKADLLKLQAKKKRRQEMMIALAVFAIMVISGLYMLREWIFYLQDL